MEQTKTLGPHRTGSRPETSTPSVRSPTRPASNTIYYDLRQGLGTTNPTAIRSSSFASSIVRDDDFEHRNFAPRWSLIDIFSTQIIVLIFFTPVGALKPRSHRMSVIKQQYCLREICFCGVSLV